MEIHPREVDELKNEAQMLLREGNYLQSLEQFSKILVVHTQDQEALEGRISACLELNLFHRCLKDIEILTQICPTDTKIHNMAGYIYEQIGANERSVCAYLNAYVYEQQTEVRLEIIQKISQLCSIFLPELHEELTGQNLDDFQMLLLLSNKLVGIEKFQVCLDMVVAGIMAHCLDGTSLKAFTNELNIFLERNNSKKDKISDTSKGNESTEGIFEKNAEQAERTQEKSHSVRVSRSHSEVASTLNREYKLDALLTTSNSAKINLKLDGGVSSYETNSLDNIETYVGKLKTCEESMLNEETSDSCRNKIDFNGTKNVESIVPDNHVGLPESFTKEPTKIAFLPNINPKLINDMLAKASDCCYELGKKETALWFAKTLLANSQSSKNLATILKANSRLGFLFSESENNSTSLLYYTKVRANCRELLDDKNMLAKEMEISIFERKTILMLCMLLKELELYEEAELLLKEYFSKADIVRQDSLVRAYDLLGEIELTRRRYEDAIKSHRTQLALCLKYDDQPGIAIAYSKLGKAYQASGNNVRAMEWFQMSLHTANTINNPLCVATAYSCIGEELLIQNNPEQASVYFQKQFELSTAIIDEPLRCQALYGLGLTYRDLRLFQHSEFFLKRALFESGDLKLHLEHKIKESLVKVLLTLSKSSEALKLLFEMRDTLELKFHKMRGYKIVVHHPLLDKLNTCVDEILELLAEEDKQEEALELAERANSILLNQMLAYRADVLGLQVANTDMNPAEIYQVVSSKVVLYYRVVKNGFMVWVLNSTHGIVHFHWFQAPSGSSFQGMVENFMNGLLKPIDPLAEYSCDHRKISHATNPQVSNKSHDIPQGSTSRQAKDFLRELSRLLISPIEEVLDNVDMSTHDIVIINNSYLSMIPFTELYTSTGRTLQDLATSVQLLPCISVLKFSENNNSSPRGIRVIGNPEVKFPEMLSGFQGHVQPDFLKQELNDVAVLLGTRPDVGAAANKEYFFREFSSTSLLHLSTYGSHDHGTMILAPIPDNNPSGVSSDSWEITLEDIVECRRAPEVVVLNSCYGCRNLFKELVKFNSSLPLAMMLAGVKTVVMATWSTPQKALLTCLRHFYKNLSEGLSVTCSVSRAKTYVKEIEEFQEPLYWSSLNVYGQNSMVNMEELRRSMAEALFDKAQNLAVERFEVISRKEESSDGFVAQCLKETVIGVLHRHHLHPNLLPILLQVTSDAIAMLQASPKTATDSTSLPYREVTPSWLPLILRAEKFLLSLGFLIKTTSSSQTILVYPHWNENSRLEKVLSLLQSVSDILTYCAVLADALRAVLSQEEKSVLVSFRSLLQQKLAHPYEVEEISSTALLRMFWLKRSTRRLMVQFGFRQLGDIIEFRNSKDDRNAIESCLNVFTFFAEFESSTEIKLHPMLSKANPRASWMSYRATNEENVARYLVAESLDSIDTKYKMTMKDVRKWHSSVLHTQAKLAESKRQKVKLDEQKGTDISKKQTSSKTRPRLPQIKITKRQPLDLIKLGEKFSKIKVHSVSSPSCVRVPVKKEQSVPLVDCMVKQHEAVTTLYQCLDYMRSKKREEMRKLLSL